MKNILAGHCYGSTWGIACFYDDVEAAFRAVFESGADFYAEWGAKKEVVYAEVERSGDDLRISVRSSIDELAQIVDTAIWRAFGGNEFAGSGYHAICKLHDLDPKEDREKVMAILEEIEDGLRDIYQEDFELYQTLPASASFEEMVAVLNKLEDEVSQEGEACYQSMVEYIQIWWDSINEQADMDSGRFA